MNKVSYLPLAVIVAASITTAYADEDLNPQNDNINQPRVAYQENTTTINESDPGKEETAASIKSFLKGKNPASAENTNRKPEPAAKAAAEPQTASRQENTPPNTDSQEIASNEADARPEAPAKTATLPPMRRFQIIGHGQFAYNMDCFVKGEDILCKGSLNNQPESYKAYESTLIGKMAGTTIKGTVSSYARIVSGDAEGKCITSTENNWPMTITLNTDHEAVIEAGEVKSYVNSTGAQSCAGTNQQTYPGKTITMKWRMLS